MKTFVIGDIHGGLKALLQILNKISLNTFDRVVFLGDYVDGWSESPDVLNYLIILKQSHNCVFIKGNHDDLLLGYLKTNSYNEEWFVHGGKSTVDAYKKVDSVTVKKHIDFLEALEPFFIDEENRLFIHAGFTNLKGVAYEYFKPTYYWDRTLWETALCINPTLSQENTLYPSRFKLYKEIYIGHTPVTRIGKTTPFQAANIWNIDTGAAFKGPLSVLDVETKEFWQSQPLIELYPYEIGRN